MKIAGSVTDATLIRAALDKAYKSLPDALNPNNVDGVSERGATTAHTRVAVVENGKIKEAPERAEVAVRVVRATRRRAPPRR